jgi:hypothetical protein
MPLLIFINTSMIALPRNNFHPQAIRRRWALAVTVGNCSASLYAIGKFERRTQGHSGSALHQAAQAVRSPQAIRQKSTHFLS